MDPESYEVNVGAARWALYTHKPERAVEYLKAASKADPTDVWAEGMAIQAYEDLGDKQGKAAAARECLTRVEKVLQSEQDNSNALGFGISALVTLGELERARDWAELVLLIDPENSNALYNTACGMAKAGEDDLAFELLEKVVAGIGLKVFSGSARTATGPHNTATHASNRYWMRPSAVLLRKPANSALSGRDYTTCSLWP